MSRKKKEVNALEAELPKQEEAIVHNEEITEKEVNSYFEEEPEPDEFPEEFLEEKIEEEEIEFIPETPSMSFEDETRAKERALRKR